MTDLFPDLRAELARAAEVDARRRRVRERAAPLVLAVTAAVLLGMVAVGWPDAKVDIAAQASAALAAEPGEIIHTLVTVTERTAETPAGRPRSETIERWEATNPTRGRVWIRASSEPVGGVQFPYGSEYYERTTPNPDESPGRPPAGTSAANPAAEVKRLLDQGLLHDVGDATVDGRAVRRLEGQIPTHGLLQDVRYDVDPETYAPVRLQSEITPLVDGMPRSSDTLTRNIDFVSIERLPLNARTADLLAVQPDSKDAPTTSETEAQMRRGER